MTAEISYRKTSVKSK